MTVAIPVSEINESSALPSKVEQAELNDQAIEEEQQECGKGIMLC